MLLILNAIYECVSVCVCDLVSLTFLFVHSFFSFLPRCVYDFCNLTNKTSTDIQCLYIFYYPFCARHVFHRDAILSCLSVSVFSFLLSFVVVL